MDTKHRSCETITATSTKEEDGAECTDGGGKETLIPISSGRESPSSFRFEDAETALTALSSSTENKLLAKKWNLDTFSASHTFQFSGHVDEDNLSSFLTQFFNDKVVRSSFRVASRTSMTNLMGTSKGVVFRRLRTSVTNMSFFERLRTEGIVASSGYIRKCMEDMIDGVSAADKLRRMLVDEDDEDFCLYDDDEKEEFLFHIFKRLVIGGSMCQWEDQVEPYEKMTKEIYRELLRVHKSKRTGKIEVASVVLDVTDIDGMALFPTESEHNFCYVVVDPIKRCCNVWYHAFVPYW